MIHRIRVRIREFLTKTLDQQSIERLAIPIGSYTALTSEGLTEIHGFPIFGPHHLDLHMRRAKPASYLAEIRDALIHGQSLAIMTRTGLRRGIHWMAAPELDLKIYSANYQQFFAEGPDGFTFKTHPTLRPDRTFQEAVILSNRFSRNYFHWLTEGITRGLLVAPDDLAGRPVIVPEMPPQHLELLRLAFPQVRVEVIAPHQLIRVKRATIPVVGAYSPEVPALTKLSGFDVSFIAALRGRVSHVASPYWSRPGEFLYISRRLLKGNPFASRRNIRNQDEVEDFVSGLGAHIIHAETLSARQQIEAFASAELVMLPTGSAIANMIFCRPGATVVCLCQNRLVNPEYFAMLADACGVRFAAVACTPAPDAGEKEIHADFLVDRTHLMEALQWARRLEAA